MSIQFHQVSEVVKKSIEQFIQKWKDETPSFITKTSGSTGTPKEITIQKKHAIASAKNTLQFFNIQPNETALLCLNPETIGGKMMIVRSLIGSLNLIATEPSSNPLKNISTHIDFIALAPLQLKELLENEVEKLKAIRTIIVGGGVITTEINQLLKAHQLSVYQTFGMTETISHIALKKTGWQEKDYYTTLPSITIDEKDGQLVIYASGLGQDILHTNDKILKIDATHFKWIGRTDFVINSGGVKIQLEQLEQELKQHIPYELFVHPKKDARLGEKVVLVICCNDKQLNFNKLDFVFLSNPYYIPKEVAFIPKFILTPSGKINRIATFESINEFKQVL